MSAASIRRQFDAAQVVGPVAAEALAIKATPFRWPDHRTLPRRPWVWGRWLLRSTVSAIVAPGGVGKSSFVASMLLSLASGREDILGKTVWAGSKRVWYWNLEDSLAELEMQLVAAAMFHRVDQAACGDRIHLDSGPDGAGLCIAIEGREGYAIAVPVVEALVAELLSRQIDVLVIDPFVSSHGVSENDNVAIDAVAKAWARIAKRANCSVVLVHHSKKLGSEKVTAESSRGASALVSAARVTLVLNRMDKDEAKACLITEERERRRLFTVLDDKANRAPATDAEWFRIASQDVGNAEGPDDPFGADGDNVGVVTRWSPPDAFEGISTDHLRRVQEAVAAGSWRKDGQAKDWVGKAVADVLGLDLSNDKDKARVREMLKQWHRNGALDEETRKDGKGNDRPFVIVGRRVDDHSSPHHPQVGSGGEVGTATPHHHRPIKGRGGGGDGGYREGKEGEEGGEAPRNPALGSKDRAPRDFSRWDGQAVSGTSSGGSR
ncbi:helicase RepA family protein [Sphingomonas sp. RHCKR7]|uniref:AAA family ATPase n=1 Tax=Sphingomonas folli TaxID=2862497 RepID=UPI001C6799E3|nr:AAA family ATPase [Sphingomonas folli]MBW6528722.1 helicase RepA family protein [Sphingomonas folli]